MDKNMETLLDEVAKAEAVIGDEYSAGYYDGLYMALSIMRGKHE
ncbi:hypothetical protein UFOVP536_68 [uncultured Caudovirales phage]|uniref:Uncharacterized protein n=1 Tax=uncultured Caudovirales phage TaxID=2100421 RepID=A0A6J5MW05_9CAUD|nr:hypothetical protein UFOVP536_68 [uncultured Caudovirales phage]